MTTLLFSLALIVLIGALIALSMRVKHLSEEIDELKNAFEYHKKYISTKVAEQENKKFIQLLNKLKE